MSRPIAHLNIAKLREGLYRYSLDQPGSVGPIGLDLQVEIEMQDLAALSREVAQRIDEARLAAGTQTANFDNYIAQICRGLYRCLFHGRADSRLADLRNALQTLKSPLLITTDDAEILWELLNDGQNFLGLKYDVGRRLKTRLLPAPVVRPKRQWRALIVADPNGGDTEWELAGARSEGRRVREWLEKRGTNCDDYLECKDATYEAVLRKMASHEYDIIHYAGHVVFDPQRETYALRLQGGQLFNATSIQDQLRGAPIVFLNGCWSARTPLAGSASPASGNGQAGAQSAKVETLTDAFLRAGAQLVVGSLFAVPDEGGYAFAEKFYEALLNGYEAGEAMRLARHHLIGRPGCGASWACFVMYGDPSLAPFQDDLHAALRAIGLARVDFDSGSYQVLESARALARVSRLIGSAELLYAMLGGRDEFLRDRLRDRGAAPDRVQEELRAVFASALVNREEGLQFSEHVKSILMSARQAAKSRGSLITEIDFVRGFAGRAGGRAKTIIGRIVPPQDLNPDAGSQPLRALCDRVGPVRPGNCEPEVWRILILAVSQVLRVKGEKISTDDLFAAMRQNPAGLLARALTRFGIPRTAGVTADPMPFAATFMPCSDNTAAILAEAQKIAAAAGRNAISESDLLAGFVQTGGGECGRRFRGEGWILQILLSALFTETGELDFSRFDEASAEILRAGLEVARCKGREQWGCGELLYGFLSSSRGSLPMRLREDRIDIEQLTAIWYARLKSGRMISGIVGLLALHMEPELQRLLCLAGSYSASNPGQPVREAHLFQALLGEGGGDAVEFLIRSNLNLPQLLKRLG